MNYVSEQVLNNKVWDQSLDKDWHRFPKLRHNLWTTFADSPDVTYLTVSHGKYETPTDEARIFLTMRSFCTGHHSRKSIIEKSGVSPERGEAVLQSLEEADVFRPTYRSFAKLTPDSYRSGLLSACRIWSEQMAETNIAVDIMAGTVTPSVVIGWMLETYHYIRAFPEAVQVGADAATGELRSLLLGYAEQERGHDSFVLRTLEALGLSREEVVTSIPLVSTRMIDLLMREMFSETPMAALVLAAIVEASELEEDSIDGFMQTVTGHYGFAPNALAPFFDHSRIDEALGHATLAERHPHLITVSSETQLHQLVNRLHDIKHAFDLQKMEIKEYYAHPGNYIPRQFVDYFAV